MCIRRCKLRMGGLFVNQFNRFGRQWKVFVEAEAADRSSVSSISQYYVRNQQGHDGAALDSCHHESNQWSRTTRTGSTFTAQRR